jgi:CRISPR/Cas system-associated protein endoribonuclease Cas2
MATTQRQNAIEKEGRLQLAKQAYEKNQISTYLGAATSYDVSRKSLKRRIKGIEPQIGHIAKNRLLTITEEKALVQWILSMDQRGMPPRIAIVRDMARVLLTQRSLSTTPPTIGENWPRNFINRHDTLKTKYNRKYDY